jgi:hypothetical protein
MMYEDEITGYSPQSKSALGITKMAKQPAKQRSSIDKMIKDLEGTLAEIKNWRETETVQDPTPTLQDQNVNSAMQASTGNYAGENNELDEKGSVVNGGSEALRPTGKNETNFAADKDSPDGEDQKNIKINLLVAKLKKKMSAKG